MIFTPKAIFFDWDHTLWDHDANAKESLEELFHSFELHQKSTHSFDEFFEIYQKVNTQLWEDYQFGRIDQQTLRETRFKKVFDVMGIDGPHLTFGDEFLEKTPRKIKLISGAKEIIESLATQYKLYVLTNGFTDVQEIKISGSGLKHYFEQIITSQEAQAKKPDEQFYHYALHQAACRPEEALMIGDHYTIDVVGAEQVGIPAIHYCENRRASLATRKIEQLNELKDWIVF